VEGDAEALPVSENFLSRPQQFRISEIIQDSVVWHPITSVPFHLPADKNNRKNEQKLADKKSSELTIIKH